MTISSDNLRDPVDLELERLREQADVDQRVCAEIKRALTGAVQLMNVARRSGISTEFSAPLNDGRYELTGLKFIKAIDPDAS